jgi:hypothetical protein
LQTIIYGEYCSGGIGEDNPLKFAHNNCCGIAIERAGRVQVVIASRDAPAALLGRPSGGRRERGGRPARGGRQPCPAGAPLEKIG